MILPFQLRRGKAPDDAPAAWFLPGDSSARWLEELARAGLAHSGTRLYAVARSLDNSECAGLLAIPGNANQVPSVPAGIACRAIAQRLFVPTEALVHPPVTDSEVLKLCSQPVSFFHPVHGLSGFDEESVLRVTDLLQPPEEREGSWNFARPGEPGLPELTAVVLLQPPTLDEAFGDAPNEIGTDPIDVLPPSPDEPSDNPLSNLTRTVSGQVLKGISGALGMLPHTGAQMTWVNHVENWANQHLKGLMGRLDQLRNKELHRLLHLLDSDPEQGLRHAIPLSSFANRGVAPPGAHLGPRSLNFDPRKLGGGPADFWNIPGDLQEVLRRRYREMADREMQLGRHRRAAYIYAQLLGDLVSAANALRQGRFFREAALVYEEHLRNPLEAARCLAEGGLLAEAIEKYEKLERWLEAADLYERADNPAEAALAIRKVVDERFRQHDILGAARLIEERLRAPDEALELLLGAWPSSAQAASCVGAAFELLGRLGRHEVTLERLAQFNRQPVPDSLVMGLLSILGTTARNYPHDRVRHRAADFSRILIAAQLQKPRLPSTEVARLLDSLVRLAPQDKLVARDANRYLMDSRAAEWKVQRAVPPVTGAKPVMIRRIELPRQIPWLELRAEWHWFYALGATPKRTTLLRGIWEGSYQSLSWDCPAEAIRQGFIFEPTREQGRAVVLARPGGPGIPQKSFPPTDQFFNRDCVTGTPSWLPPQAYPVAFGEDNLWSIHVATGRAILSCHSKNTGNLLKTIDITVELLGDAERTNDTRLCITALPNSAAVALGNRLVLLRGEGGPLRVELPGQAVRLVPTIPNTRQGVAVMLHNGAVMYWLGADSCLELVRDCNSPRATFVPSGPLVIVSGTQATLLEVDSRGVHNVTRLDLPQQAVGLSGTANPGEFAILTEKGELTVYRMPR